MATTRRRIYFQYMTPVKNMLMDDEQAAPPLHPLSAPFHMIWDFLAQWWKWPFKNNLWRFHKRCGRIILHVMIQIPACITNQYKISLSLEQKWQHINVKLLNYINESLALWFLQAALKSETPEPPIIAARTQPSLSAAASHSARSHWLEGHTPTHWPKVDAQKFPKPQHRAGHQQWLTGIILLCLFFKFCL